MGDQKALGIALGQGEECLGIRYIGVSITLCAFAGLLLSTESRWLKCTTYHAYHTVPEEFLCGIYNIVAVFKPALSRPFLGWSLDVEHHQVGCTWALGELFDLQQQHLRYELQQNGDGCDLEMEQNRMAKSE